MIDWRSETVMTFQVTAMIVEKAVKSQTKGQKLVSPMISATVGKVKSARASVAPLPRRDEIFGARRPPINPPTAPAVPRIANTRTEVFKISCAKRMKSAVEVVARKLSKPRMIAIGLKSSCRQSHWKPSLISAFILTGCFTVCA